MEKPRNSHLSHVTAVMPNDVASLSASERVTEWLLRHGFPGVTRTQALAGDASTRRYIRIGPTDGASLVLLLHPSSFEPTTDSFLNVGDLFRRMGIAVPTVRGHDADLGIVALDDLGDVTLQDYLTRASVTDRHARYAEAVTLIARIQTQGAAVTPERYQPFGLAFDVKKLRWELDFFAEHFLFGHRAATFSSGHRAGLTTEFTTLAEELAAEPRVLCHRDFHSRNLMWHRDTLYVIDFQDARMGPNTYDVASLLRDSYVELESTLFEDMVETFQQAVPPSAGRDFARRLDVMSVQRNLKALGTFGYQATAGNSRYEKDIPRTLGYLRQVFDRHRRFDRLRSILAAAIPELG